MRVLHVITSLAPRHGGPTKAILSMVRALRSEGVEAAILSSNDDVGRELDVPLDQWVDREGAPCWFIRRVPAKQHTLVGFNFAPGFVPWLTAHIREFEFVHIHTVFSYPANVAMRIAAQAGVPFCVRPLGQLCSWSMQQRSFAKRLQLAAFTRKRIDKAAFIHVTSDMEAEETDRLGFEAPCRVLPHGIDLPAPVPNASESLRQDLGIPPTTPVIAYMSRFHPKKGIELLLDACGSLQQEYQLVLAGTGDDDYVATLKRRISDLEIGVKVNWYGFVEGDRKWRLLQGADIFALTSHSENFGIAVLEALACGVPVLVSDQVALASVISSHDAGRVVPIETEAIRVALEQLLGCPQDRQRLGANALALAQQNFSWSAAAQALLQAYRDAISSASSKQ